MAWLVEYGRTTQMIRLALSSLLLTPKLTRSLQLHPFYNQTLKVMNTRIRFFQTVSFHLIGVKQWASKRREALLLALILISNLFITLPFAAVLNIWTDEAYSLNTSGRDIQYAIHQAIFFEEQAPLYFVLLNLWRGLNDSIFFARLFSIICISLTIYITNLLARKLFTNQHSGWVTAAIAFHPFAIWAALEIRMYAFSILLSALLLLLFFEAYLKDSPNRILRGLYILVAIISLYTHYFLASLLVANAIALFCLGKKRVLFHYLVDLAVVGILFTPMVFYLIHQLSLVTEDKDIRVPAAYLTFLPQGLRKVLSMGLSYVFPMPRPLRIDAIHKALLMMMQASRFLILVILVVFVLKYHHRLRIFRSPLYLVTAVSALLFTAAFSLVEGVSSTHSDSLFIPVVLSTFGIVIGIQSINKKVAVHTWFTLAAIFYLITLCVTYAPIAKGGDFFRVASYIEANEKPNQTILAFNPEVGMMLEYYYAGTNEVVVLPKEMDFQQYTWKNFILNNEQEITQALSSSPGEHSTIWLVTDPENFPVPKLYAQSRRILKRFIDQRYSIVSTKAFYGSTVQLLNYTEPI